MKIGVAMVTIVGVGVTAWLRLERMHASRPKVWIERVARHDVVEGVVAKGTVVRAPSVIVSADADGRVSAVTARTGQRVAVGDPLLVLDPRPFALKVERARAAVAARKADKERAVLAVEQASSRARLADSGRARGERLFAVGIESAQAVGEATHRALVADLEVVAQRHKVAGAVAEAFAAAAALADALREADRSVVRAPTGGEIVEIGVEQGQWVHAEAIGVAPTTLLTIAPAGASEIEVHLEQGQATRAQVGQSASVTLETLSASRLRARVVSKRAGAAGRLDGTAPLRLRLEEQPPGVRVGLTATVRIPIEARSQVPAIPNHAVRSAPRHGAPRRGPVARAARTETAWVIRDGLVRERTLVTGLRGDTHTEVLAGLTLGESVVTGPYALVRSIGVGDAVIPVRAPIVSR